MESCGSGPVVDEWMSGWVGGWVDELAPIPVDACQATEHKR
jgi:hypothetical protein